jgi:hypothetical protein
MKQLILLFILLVGVATQIGAQTAKTSAELSLKDKQNSILFQSLKGKDRLDVYKQLQTLIKTADAGNDIKTKSTRLGVTTTTLADLVAILGEPDAKIQQTIVQYNLKASPSSSKLVVGLNQKGEVQFCTIKN